MLFHSATHPSPINRNTYLTLAMNLSDKGFPKAGATRSRIVALLRRGTFTVDELAEEVGTTDNSVRSHLTALERDRIVRQEGTRRGVGAGKPAVLYSIHPDAEAAFSHAYQPVLSAFVEAVVAELPPERQGALLEDVGHRLSVMVGGEAKGTLRQRVEAAAAVLAELGGDVEILADPEDPGAGLVIRGFGCPLSRTVAEHPETCHAVTTLVGDVSGRPVEQRCEHGARPRCRFRVG